MIRHALSMLLSRSCPSFRLYVLFGKSPTDFKKHCLLLSLISSLRLCVVATRGAGPQITLEHKVDLTQIKSVSAAPLDDYIATESPIALQGILSNIGADGFGADGSRVLGAAPGLVVASPSKSNPDCKKKIFHVQRLYDLTSSHMVL